MHRGHPIPSKLTNGERHLVAPVTHLGFQEKTQKIRKLSNIENQKSLNKQLRIIFGETRLKENMEQRHQQKLKNTVNIFTLPIRTFKVLDLQGFPAFRGHLQPLTPRVACFGEPRWDEFGRQQRQRLRKGPTWRCQWGRWCRGRCSHVVSCRRTV